MSPHPHTPRSRPGLRRGFSLIEIMVVVSMLAIIILGLVGMFNQTTRAFRAGVSQTDVLEGGRATMDLLVREMEQAAASGMANTTNLYVRFNPLATPLALGLTGGGSQLNVLNDIRFLHRSGDEWNAVGYRVFPTNNNAVGTLYRFSSEAVASTLNRQNPTAVDGFVGGLMNELPPFFPTNAFYHRVADGIVHLSIRVFDKDGRLITSSGNTNVVVGAGNWTFRNTEVPAYLELELGLMEPEAYEQFKAQINSISWNNAGELARVRSFLQRKADKVHLFRQRISIRTANR